MNDQKLKLICLEVLQSELHVLFCVTFLTEYLLNQFLIIYYLLERISTLSGSAQRRVLPILSLLILIIL